MSRQFLNLIVCTLTLVPCVMQSKEPTPKKGAEPKYNQVYVKIIMPTDPPDRDNDQPIVESWIAEDLKKRGQAKFIAVTEWVPLDLSLLGSTDVWDGVLGSHHYCPVGADIERKKGSMVEVHLSGWSPGSVRFTVPLKDEPGAHAIAAVKKLKLEGGMPYVAVFIGLPAPVPARAFEPRSETEQIERLTKSVSLDQKQRRAGSEARKKRIDGEIQDLQRLFDTNDPAQRQKAISRILSSRDARFLPVIVELLKDPNADNRGQAIMALYRQGAKKAADKIGVLVSSDPSASVRHQAAEYGTRLGYRSSMKEIKRFLAEEDFTSQSIALHLSNSLRDDQEVELLAAFLDHKINHLRSRAVRRLMRHDPKLIRPHVMNVLGLVRDVDDSVRHAVAREERVLQELATIDDLRKLSLQDTPIVKAMAYRMLRQRGEDTTARMLPFLSAKEPELRQEALLAFTAAGEGPEKEIVALLGDTNSRVNFYALEATRRLRLRSAVPKLREIFEHGERYDRKQAASALLEMSESVWGPRELPKVEGTIFNAVARLASTDDAAAWGPLFDGADGIVNELAKLKAFPCERDDMLTAARAKGYKVMRLGEGRITERRCIGGNVPQRVQNAVIAHHGDLIVKGLIHDGIVVVTGDLYLHDGYVNDSIVIVQGNFVCGGYIKNSVVLVGQDETLRVVDGHVSNSVIAAGTIASDDCYTSQSLYSGRMVSPNGASDVRNSRKFDAVPIYDSLRN